MACQYYLINSRSFSLLTRFCLVELQADQSAGQIVLWLPWITTFRTCLRRVKIDLGQRINL